MEPGDVGDKISKELEQILNFSPFTAYHFQKSSWFSWAKEGLQLGTEESGESSIGAVSNLPH